MKPISMLLLILPSLLLTSCAEKHLIPAKSLVDEVEHTKPKNIVFLIGDGMGLSQISATQFYGDQPSNFERFPVVGLIKTSSSSHLITDSAAGATAFSTGKKTYNKAIGVGPDAQAIETIVEKLSKQGYDTGLVATSSITHATPASFYAHVKTRYEAEEIASFMPDSDIDFFAAAGLKYFNERDDGRNLLEELATNGFQIDTLGLPTKISEKKNAILLARDKMPKMRDGRGSFLKGASLLAIERLSQNKNGYFLMIESSQIDWGGHDMDPDYLITEQLDFDKTIGALLDYFKNDPKTLIVVTADHETGAFALAMDNKDYNKIKPTAYSGDHSATMVPVFAKGPGASLFGGIYENTDIYHKMIEALGK